MDEKNKLIDQLIKEKGGTRQQYLHLLNSIANHETGGTYDPTTKQEPRAGYRDAPGRGKYQFEMGNNMGGITAARRTVTYYKNNKLPVSKWLQDASKGKDLDASTLSSEQQDILFLGNMREHPKADLAQIMNKTQSIPEFWANYHWSGKDRNRNARLKDFKQSYENFSDKTPLPTFNGPQNNLVDDKRYTITPKIDSTTLTKSNPAQAKTFAYGGELEVGPTAPTVVTKNYKAGLQGRGQDISQDTIIPNYKTTLPYSTPQAEYRNTGNSPLEQNTNKSFVDWYSNKITQDRFAKQSNYSTDQLNDMVTHGVKTNMVPVNKVDNNAVAEYDSQQKKIFYNLRTADTAVLGHEKIHAGGIDAAMGPYLAKQLGNVQSQKKLAGTSLPLYMSQEHEGYGNFAEFRNRLGYKPGQQITKEQLKKLVNEKGLQNENFYKVFDDENIVKALNTVATNSNRSNINYSAYGGLQNNSLLYRKNFNSFNGGGTHEQNRYGGIPLGMGQNGKRNTVENNESAYNFKSGKYIFSDRIFTNGIIKK